MNNNLTRELVSRTNQLSFFKYIGILPNPDKLLSGSERNTKKYKELINEPHLWSCIQSRKSGVLSHSYQIIQNNSPTSTFEFIKNNFAQIDTNKLIREMLDAVLYGFQPFEIIWKEICYNARILFIIERIEARPQEYFVYDLKGKLKIKSFTKPQGNSIPNFKIINVQHEANYENPYGQALLSKCYWAATFKNSAMRFWINFIEKFGKPTIIATVGNPLSEELPPDEELQKHLVQLQKMQEQNTIVTAGNIKIELHDNNKSGNVELYKELINICNAEISKAILSQTLTTEIDGGSFAAAKTHLEIRNEVVHSDMELVEKSMNEIISNICTLNFGHIAAPKFCFEK